MKLGDLLSGERIRIPLRGRTTGEGFRELAGLLAPDGTLDATIRPNAAKQSPSGHSLILILPDKAHVSDPAVAVGVAPRPFEPGDPTRQPPGEGARILVLATAGGLSRDARLRIESVFSDPKVEGALLRADAAAQILSLRRLTELELHSALRVSDVMVPLSYRIYPDTPLDEVLDLMVRRRLSAVPVVGDGLQVLGVISAADILRYGMQSADVPRGPSREGDPVPTARSIMSRSVMCVTEDDLLRKAAQLMANRNVAQLPVVREGEIVGFLTREGVLSGLFGETKSEGGPIESTREIQT